MSHITTTDNNRGKLLSVLNDDGEKIDYRTSAADINRISNRELSEFYDEDNLLIFPSRLEESADLLKKTRICSFIKAEKPEGSILTTENIAGFIGINDTELSITSRFSQGGEDYFLHYMIQKVLNLNVTNLRFSSSADSVLNLLVYLFPRYLQNALRQGLYKEYQTFHRNDENVRGVIELPRHIKNNIPFEGKIAYKTRDYSFDNMMTELIRHTIEYIAERRDIACILSASQEIRDAVKVIREETPLYNAEDRQKVIAAALKNKRHPYFTYYAPLQKLCVQILLNKKIKLARKKNKVYGILFDVSWLWEQYLAIQLKASGFSHSDNRKGTGSISVLKNNIGRFIPDFYKAGFVIDAKYKQFDKSNPPADDLAQVIAYMHVLSIQKGGYMYPSKEQPSAATKLLGEIKGYGGTLYLFPVYIPQKCESFSEFVQAMEKQPAQDII